MKEEYKLSPLAYKEVDGEQYPPVIPASQTVTEFTLKAILIGVFIGIVFGAANAYLGLKVGQTVSASIPAAVMAVAFFKFFKKGGSLLEANIVQTIGSAGESIAAGVIFTVPAFFIWGTDISMLDITILAIVGGLIGVIFMIPLRKSLIVKEHGKLPYPEGTACAEVLVSGQGDASKAKPLFWGMGIGALFQALSHNKFFALWNREPATAILGYKGAEISGELSPELLAVGYIIGPHIAAVIFGGAFLAWFVLIPLITLFGEHCNQVIYPAADLIKNMSPGDIWSSYIKYIGAGGVAFAGMLSLLKSLPMMFSSFKASFNQMKHIGESMTSERTDNDLSFKTVIIGLIIIALIVMVYAKMRLFTDSIGLSIFTGLLVVLFGFFFVTVSARIVGMVGASACPVSGMTIATLILTCLIFICLGLSTASNIKVVILTIGAFVCCATAIADDTSQDLKTGFLVGSTPKHQQIGEIIGTIVAGLTIGFVMFFMKDAISSGELSAPQANLMRTIIDGVIDGNLPWGLIICGACVSWVVELLGASSLSFAVGMYLPISVSTPIIIGGLIRWLIDHKKDDPQLDEKRERGVLYSSGLIAGSALLGVIMMIVVAFADNFSGILTPISRAGIHIEAELTDVTINGQPFTEKYYKVAATDITAKSNEYVVKANYNGKPVEETVSLGKLDRAYLTVQDGKLVAGSEAPSGNTRAVIAFAILLASLCYFTFKKA